MEFNDSEKLAAAALFTLALHQTQVETGVDEKGNLLHENDQAWGCPSGLDICEFLTNPEIGKTSEFRFWGWDCCGPRGICQQFFKHLNVPVEKRVGLLILPGMAQDSSLTEAIERLLELVQSYCSILDPDLEVVQNSAETTAVDVRKLGDTDYSIKMKKSPSNSDNSSARKSQVDEGGQEDESEESASFGSFDLVEMRCEDAVEPLETMTSSGMPSSASDAMPDGSQVADGCESSVSTCAYEFNKKEMDEVRSTSRDATAKSCAALQLMLEACIMNPSKQDENAANEFGHEQIQCYFDQTHTDLYQARYDARCRVALKRVAHWLRIPWRTHAALEISLASLLLGLREDGSLKPSSKSISRWVKVGAAAVGGGAAIALTGSLKSCRYGCSALCSCMQRRHIGCDWGCVNRTGGLAAPAIALGLGSAVSLVGGGAATATAVTGFAASTAGTATITGAFGALGASHTGKGMARRTSGVKEFGFWDISRSWVLDDDDGDGKQTAEKSKFLASSKARFLLLMGKTKKPQKSMESLSSTEVDSSPILPVSSADITMDTSSSPPTPGDEESNSIPWESDSISPLDNPDQRFENNEKDNVSATEEDLNFAEENKTNEEGNQQNTMSSWLKSWTKAKKRAPLLACPVNSSNPEWKLGLTICVTGWVQDYKDFVDPWKSLSNLATDRYALVWEAKELKQVGDALMSLIRSQIAGQAAKWFVTRYLYAGLVQAVAFPILLLSLTSITIDNVWFIAQDRACKAGVLLARCLAEGLHARRPVTLIGFSLGARLIFYCLLELRKMGKVGIVENVILMGTPVGLKEANWCKARSVVSGRFVNGFSRNDWVLGVTYRASKAFVTRAAGCCPVNVPGIENIDLTPIVGGHTEYVARMDKVIASIDLN